MVSRPQPGRAEANTNQLESVLLQDRLNHQRLRKDFWPEATRMQNKLYRTISDLRRTASFIAATPDRVGYSSTVVLEGRWTGLLQFNVPPTPKRIYGLMD